MADKTPDQTPVGRMIEEAAKGTGESVRQLAANAGISDTRWRHIVRGWQPAPGGAKAAVPGPAATIARMAHVVGLNSEDLRRVGRDDAAAIAEKFGDTVNFARSPDLILQNADGTLAAIEIKSGSYSRSTTVNPVDEIDLIMASRMSPREKLLRIRQVLELRVQAEAEEAQTHETAPAEAAEAESAETQQS